MKLTRKIIFIISLCIVVLTATFVGLMCFEKTRSAILEHFGYEKIITTEVDDMGDIGGDE